MSACPSDALVRQMPGVEIKKDGRIYHNGQFVENLLLNGRFFGFIIKLKPAGERTDKNEV